MYKCCDKEFGDRKSFASHLRSSALHFLTLSDSFFTDLPFQYLTSVIQDKEKVVRILGFTLVNGKALIPLHTGKGAVGDVLKRSLLGEVNGPSVEGGIIKYKIDAGKVKYVPEFRASRQGDSTRLTTIMNFNVYLGSLERLLPGLVIKGLNSLVLPDEVLRNVRRSLTIESRVAKVDR